MMTTGDKQASESGTAEEHGTLGRSLRDQGRLEESAASYREATALAPGNAAFHNDLGNVLAEQGKVDEAIVSYQKALELCPEYAEAHNNLANLYQMTSRLDDAATGYEKAIGLRPDYAEAHRNLGSLFYRQGKLPESVSSLRRAVSLNPAFAEATALLEHQMRHMCEWKGLDALSRTSDPDGGARFGKGESVWVSVPGEYAGTAATVCTAVGGPERQVHERCDAVRIPG
jgi:tetratricopeptide (TPR) repeat protein